MIRACIAMTICVGMTVATLEYKEVLWAACNSVNGSQWEFSGCTCENKDANEEIYECHDADSELSVISFNNGGDCGITIAVHWLCIDGRDNSFEHAGAELLYWPQESSIETVTGCTGDNSPDCDGPSFTDPDGLDFVPPQSCEDYRLRLRINHETVESGGLPEGHNCLENTEGQCPDLEVLRSIDIECDPNA